MAGESWRSSCSSPPTKLSLKCAWGRCTGSQVVEKFNGYIAANLQNNKSRTKRNPQEATDVLEKGRTIGLSAYPFGYDNLCKIRFNWTDLEIKSGHPKAAVAAVERLHWVEVRLPQPHMPPRRIPGTHSIERIAAADLLATL